MSLLDPNKCDHTCGNRYELDQLTVHEASGMTVCRHCLVECLTQDVKDSDNHQAIYRDYVIYADGGYHARHKDYDGAPDAHDHRLVTTWTGFTMLQLLSEVDENIEWVEELQA